MNGTAQVRLARLLLSDPLQTPVITSVAPNGSGHTLSWNSISNAVYRVEYTSSFPAPNWTWLTNITSTANTTTATDYLGSAAQRYYRIALLPW